MPLAKIGCKVEALVNHEPEAELLKPFKITKPKPASQKSRKPKLGKGRYQYRYRKYRHISKFFSIGSIGIGNQSISCRYADTEISAARSVSALDIGD